MRKILITGGAGFIGSALVRYIINETSDAVVVVDKLTYAGNLMSLAPVAQSEHFAFEKVDICDRAELARVFTEHQPDCVMHLAAESHVDRSIDGPAAFIETNIVGTYTLLEAARAYWNTLTEDKKSAFRFHHISTDEVYGDLHSTDDFFTETTPYAPSSPYSASKASSDHLVRAWLRTYGLPTLITNCSNNYGPYHFPEKLIPVLTQKNTLTDTRALTQSIKSFRLKLKGTLGARYAQVLGGGVATDAVNPETCESRLHPGLFLTGELLDIDAACGGWNLQFAWSTGVLAGRAAAKEIDGV